MKHVAINVYEFDIKTGKFNILNSEICFIDENETWGDFAKFMEIENTSNKFFMVRAESIDGHDASFHTVRTDMEGNIISYENIGPNNIDKDVIIDAIIGSRIPDTFARNCDKLLKKCIQLNIGQSPSTYTSIMCTPDARQRLSKVNALRLREIYQKLKRANQ